MRPGSGLSRGRNSGWCPLIDSRRGEKSVMLVSNRALVSTSAAVSLSPVSIEPFEEAPFSGTYPRSAILPSGAVRACIGPAVADPEAGILALDAEDVAPSVGGGEEAGSPEAANATEASRAGAWVADASPAAGA